MKLDLTKNVSLEPVWQKRYAYLRILLYVIFIITGIYFSYRTLFPIQNFFIDMENLKSKENTLGIDNNPQNERIISAYSSENFSEAIFRITLEDNSADIFLNAPVEIRKTYKAFSYPLSDRPAAFPNGSLLQNNNHYYLVSGEKLRKFANSQILESLGYNEKKFVNATDEEIGFSDAGEDISDAKIYPENSLFLIDGTYYEFRGQTLYPFVSKNAYLSYHTENQAVEKNDDFLLKFPVDQDNAIGFANASLLSFDNGVFIVDNKMLVPFSNPVTFLSSGYNWDDITPASEGETSVYPRDNVFSISRPHPDGTVFFAKDSKKYYLIKNGLRKEIRGENILQYHLKHGSILAMEKSLDFKSGCNLEKIFWPLHSYQCKLLIRNLWEFPGKDYQFKLNNDNQTRISSAAVNFYRNINWENMRTILADIKMRLLRNYGYETAS